MVVREPVMAWLDVNLFGGATGLHLRWWDPWSESWQQHDEVWDEPLDMPEAQRLVTMARLELASADAGFVS